MRLRKDNDRGAAALIVAGSLIFLFGMAALAVDTSDFYQTARVGQTTADLACLAGVAELPDDSGAIDMAAAYTKANWPEMSGAALTSTGSNSAALADGNGNVVTYETNYGGDPDVMHVVVTENNPTTFGKVLGSQSVNVTQEAACERDLKLGGPGVLPMAAQAGTFAGNLHDCAENKNNGNCGASRVDGTGGNVWRDAIANGTDQRLAKHHGHGSTVDADSGVGVVNCPSTGVCTYLQKEPGNMQGPFSQGVGIRLSNVSGADCVMSGPFNCDSITQVFGSTPGTLASELGAAEPSWWEESIYGPYSAARNNQYYFNGNIAKCDSPRLAVIPIVVNNQHWDIGDPGTLWPNGASTRMKVIGFYVLYIRVPATPAQVGGGAILADIVHLGPGANCDGVPYNPYQTGIPVESVKLVGT